MGRKTPYDACRSRFLKGKKFTKTNIKASHKRCQSKKKKTTKPKGRKSHKGHRTKRGLSQDQKRVSREYHEKYYQKHK